MDRAVPLAFALLGVLVGVISQVRGILPSLLSDPSIRSLQAAFLVFGTVFFGVSTLGAVALGYWTNRWVHLSDDYVRFGLVAGVASCLGFLLGTSAVLVTSSLAPVPDMPILDAPLYAAVNVGYNALTKSVSIGLLGLAGAAIAHFREVSAQEKSGA